MVDDRDEFDYKGLLGLDLDFAEVEKEWNKAIGKPEVESPEKKAPPIIEDETPEDEEDDEEFDDDDDDGDDEEDDEEPM